MRSSSYFDWTSMIIYAPCLLTVHDSDFPLMWVIFFITGSFICCLSLKSLSASCLLRSLSFPYIVGQKMMPFHFIDREQKAEFPVLSVQSNCLRSPISEQSALQSVKYSLNFSYWIQFLLWVLSISANLIRYQVGYLERQIWTLRNNVGKFSFKQFAQCYRGHIALMIRPSFSFQLSPAFN